MQILSRGDTLKGQVYNFSNQDNQCGPSYTEKQHTKLPIHSRDVSPVLPPYYVHV